VAEEDQDPFDPSDTPTYIAEEATSSTQANEGNPLTSDTQPPLHLFQLTFSDKKLANNIVMVIIFPLWAKVLFTKALLNIA